MLPHPPLPHSPQISLLLSCTVKPSLSSSSTSDRAARALDLINMVLTVCQQQGMWEVWSREQQMWGVCHVCRWWDWKLLLSAVGQLINNGSNWLATLIRGEMKNLCLFYVCVCSVISLVLVSIWMWSMVLAHFNTFPLFGYTLLTADTVKHKPYYI